MEPRAHPVRRACASPLEATAGVASPRGHRGPRASGSTPRSAASAGSPPTRPRCTSASRRGRRSTPRSSAARSGPTSSGAGSGSVAPSWTRSSTGVAESTRGRYSPPLEGVHRRANGGAMVKLRPYVVAVNHVRVARDWRAGRAAGSRAAGVCARVRTRGRTGGKWTSRCGCRTGLRSASG